MDIIDTRDAGKGTDICAAFPSNSPASSTLVPPGYIYISHLCAQEAAQ